MEDTLKVKIQPLNAEMFRPYGEVLQQKGLIYPATEEGQVAMEMLQLKYRSNGKRMDQLAIHFSYNQTFIPVHGAMVLMVRHRHAIGQQDQKSTKSITKKSPLLWSLQGRSLSLRKAPGTMSLLSKMTARSLT